MQPATTARRIPFFRCMTPEEVAEHNRLIDEERKENEADAQAFVSQPSRFVGIQSGLPSHTTC